MLQRLPAFLHPQIAAYSHVVAIDDSGKIITSLQDFAGAYPSTTGALETDEWLFISSLHANHIARLPLEQAGLH
jgi:hypothetical protein